MWVDIYYHRDIVNAEYEEFLDYQEDEEEDTVVFLDNDSVDSMDMDSMGSVDRVFNVSEDSYEKANKRGKKLPGRPNAK